MTRLASRLSIFRIVSVIAIALVLAAAGFFAYRRLHRPASLVTASSSVRPSVAIIGFQNGTHDDGSGWLSTAFTEIIARMVAEGAEIRVVDGDATARALRDLAIAPADTIAPESLAPLQQLLAADRIISGVCLDEKRDGQKCNVLEVRILDALHGSKPVSARTVARESEMWDTAAQSAAAIRSSFGVAQLSAAQLRRLAIAVPSNSLAARRYAEGIDAARSHRPAAAIEFFRQAIFAAPDSALVHWQLARAEASLGHATAAESEAVTAVRLAANLPVIERSGIESEAAEMHGDLEGALGAARSVAERHPDEREASFRVADLLVRLGRLDEAAAAIGTARARLASGPSDPRLDLVESRLARAAADPDSSWRAALKAVSQTKGLRAASLLAPARLEEAAALMALKRSAEAADACDKAERIFTFNGDVAGSVQATVCRGRALATGNDAAGARRLIREAADRARAGGYLGLAASTLVGLASMEIDGGDRAAADRLRTEARDLYKEAGDKRSTALVANDLGMSALASGQQDQAERLLRESLDGLRGTTEKAKTALTLEKLAEISYARGEAPASFAMLQEALHLRREIADRRETAGTLIAVGKLFALQGNTARARSSYDETVIIRESLRDEASLAESHLAIAGLLMDQQQYANAAAEVEPWIQRLRDRGDDQREAEALCLLGESRLVQGQIAEASKAAEDATAAATRAKSRELERRIEILSSRIAAAARPSDAAAAASRVSAISAAAQKEGNVPLVLEAQLALAEIEKRSGRVPDAQRILASVEKDATAHGFSSVANRARSMAK